MCRSICLAMISCALAPAAFISEISSIVNVWAAPFSSPISSLVASVSSADRRRKVTVKTANVDHARGFAVRTDLCETLATERDERSSRAR